MWSRRRDIDPAKSACKLREAAAGHVPDAPQNVTISLSSGVEARASRSTAGAGPPEATNTGCHHPADAASTNTSFCRRSSCRPVWLTTKGFFRGLLRIGTSLSVIWNVSRSRRLLLTNNCVQKPTFQTVRWPRWASCSGRASRLNSMQSSQSRPDIRFACPLGNGRAALNFGLSTQMATRRSSRISRISSRL